jgi:glycosyltransferase involved in cell wall biosynthesis
MTLSVIVITKNEAAVIGRCLESASWADEIIVLDSNSTDETVSIARGHHAKVVNATDWPGFGLQKNRALALATGEWVLSLDADEWVTAELCDEIKRALAAPDNRIAFKMPRRSSFCGRFMHHSGWWPDYVTRLFRRGAGRFSEDLVHEKLLVTGAIGTFTAPLMHEAVRNLDDAIRKVNVYSSAGAEMLYQRGRRASLGTAIGHGLWAFVRTYFLSLGLLDGRAGFMLAVANAEGAYYRYLKLALKQDPPQNTIK